jgi:hypothetical protein
MDDCHLVAGAEKVLYGASANEAGTAEEKDAHRKESAVSSLTAAAHPRRPHRRF